MNQDWVELYNYVKKEILMYEDNLKLPKHIVLRLQGLNKGQFIANNKQKPNAEYPFKIILLTFKMYKQLIISSLSNINFQDEKHKFNYIMSIIEDKINDVMIRLKNIEKSEEKIENIQIINTENSQYKNTNNKKPNKKLDDIW
jgi:hypothetical protein